MQDKDSATQNQRKSAEVEADRQKLIEDLGFLLAMDCLSNSSTEENTMTKGNEQEPEKQKSLDQERLF